MTIKYKYNYKNLYMTIKKILSNKTDFIHYKFITSFYDS
jgi:hypothetical protein